MADEDRPTDHETSEASSSAPDEAAATAPPKGTTGKAPSKAAPTRDSVPEQIREFVGTGVFWATLLIILIAGAIVAIVVQNTHDVDFEFFWLRIEVPLLTVILITSLISVLGVEVATAIWRVRRRRVLNEREELRRLRGRTAAGEKQSPGRGRRRRR